MFFFFKQKTAYEMRISDWSSDVCSSDLLLEDFLGLGMSLLTLLIRGACGDIYLNMTEIDAGGLYEACLVLLVVFMQIVVADRRQVLHGRCFVEQQILGADLFGQFQRLLEIGRAHV